MTIYPINKVLRLCDWLIEYKWLGDRVTDWLTDWLATWLADWLTGWLADLLTGCLTDLLTDWLIMTSWLQYQNDLMTPRLYYLSTLKHWVTSTTDSLTAWLPDWKKFWLTIWVFRSLTPFKWKINDSLNVSIWFIIVLVGITYTACSCLKILPVLRSAIDSSNKINFSKHQRGPQMAP